jgi:tRNA-uridine 2-sulfurtransferase
MGYEKYNKKVILGMSGGVDSAVCAYLLKQQGYNVTAVFMQNWDQADDENCTANEDLKDALQVCQQLEIPFETINFAKEYWRDVFENFLSSHQQGLTPNPDILCNSEIKFKKFLEYALSKNADYIATGHYAKIIKNDNSYLLSQPKDSAKDQTYFLHLLQQYQLQKTLFPLAEYTKPEVRAIAAKINLANGSKKDSTGICFIGERKYNKFLSEFMLSRKGDIVTENGEKISTHNGLMFYTIGQRKGINLGGIKEKKEQPWYVLAKDLKNNTLIIGQGKDNPKLYNSCANIARIHWIAEKPSMPFKCMVKIRYNQILQECEVIENQEQFKVKFNTKQRAITPGQSAVFYLNGICYGGGVILS